MSEGRGPRLVILSVIGVLGLEGCGDASDEGSEATTATSTTTVVLRTTSAATTSSTTSSTASSTSSSTSSTLAHGSSSPGCADGVEVASIDLSAGPVRIVDAGDRFCLLSDISGPVEIPLNRSIQPDVPTLLGSGASFTQGQHHLVAVPPDVGPVEVRNESGETVLSVRSADGSHLLIFDADVSGSQIPFENYVSRTWDLLAPDGTVIGQITVHSPPPGTAPTDIFEVLTCLKQQGLRLAILENPGQPPEDADLDVQPYAPNVATSAWTQCRDLMIEALEDLGTPDASIADSMRFYDCMAQLGWIQAFSGAESLDDPAHGEAVESCR